MSDEEVRRPLDEQLLRKRVLSNGSPWTAVEVVETTRSTNADLIERSSAASIDGLILIAENQTAGRGRNGRSWRGVPRAQITMSMGIAVADLPPRAWGWVPLVTGLAVVDAVRETTAVQVALKWPNDVLSGTDGLKLGGILSEVVASAPMIVVGVGLNVSLRTEEVPDFSATSLALLGATNLDRVALVTALTQHIARRLDQLRRAGCGDETLIAEYAERSLTIGTKVRATLPGGKEIVGVAHTVDDLGRLHIDGNCDVPVSAGDIEHLRPA